MAFVRRLPFLGVAGVLCLCLVSCGGSSHPGHTQTGSVATSPSQVATVPATDLIKSGELAACMEPPLEPLQFFDSTGHLVGVDADLMAGVARRLGLRFVVVRSNVATEIAALKSGKCDVIVADQYVTASRKLQVNMVAYAKGDEVLVVAGGNPQHISGTDGLCGHSAAGETGAVEIQILHGLSASCVKSGQKPIDVQEYGGSQQALQSLLSGHVQGWMTGQIVALTAKAKHNLNITLLDPFSAPNTENGLVAMSFVKSNTGLMSAMISAMKAMAADGSYQAVFDRYHVRDVMVDPPYLVP